GLSVCWQWPVQYRHVLGGNTDGRQGQHEHGVGYVLDSLSSRPAGDFHGDGYRGIAGVRHADGHSHVQGRSDYLGHWHTEFRHGDLQHLLAEPRLAFDYGLLWRGHRL